MLIYVYDGSFEGLLTAIYESFYRKPEPGGIAAAGTLQKNFIEEYVYIETSYDKYKKVYDSIWKKISYDTLQRVYYVHLSGVPEAGTVIYKYLKLGWKVGKSVNERLADNRVLSVLKIFQRVGLERHRLMGFIRFQLLEGNIYYAPIEPDNDVTAILAPHFANRMADQNWVIHDLKRNIAAVYNRSKWVMIDAAIDEIPDVHEKELEYQKLWKGFFDSIAIDSRKNPALQRRLMPVRYWNHLTEMQETKGKVALAEGKKVEVLSLEGGVE